MLDQPPIINKVDVDFEVQGFQVTDCYGTTATYDLFAVIDHMGVGHLLGHCKCLNIFVEEFLKTKSNTLLDIALSR